MPLVFDGIGRVDDVRVQAGLIVVLEGHPVNRIGEVAGVRDLRGPDRRLCQGGRGVVLCRILETDHRQLPVTGRHEGRQERGQELTDDLTQSPPSLLHPEVQGGEGDPDFISPLDNPIGVHEGGGDASRQGVNARVITAVAPSGVAVKGRCEELEDEFSWMG